MMLTGSQIFVEVLAEQGVDTIFGYPGGAVLNLYDELYKNSDRIRHILTAHEQGASHAADGYARATGRTGVVLATSGPGATNLVTGIATAYMDSVPMVAFTGNVATSLLGRDSFQEAYIEGVTMPITKHNYTVRRVEDLADTMRAAFRIAQSGRKGPVLVDIPKDVTANSCEFTPKAPEPVRTVTRYDEESVLKAAEMINEAKRPLVCFGGGVPQCGRLPAPAGPAGQGRDSRHLHPDGCRCPVLRRAPQSGSSGHARLLHHQQSGGRSRPGHRGGHPFLRPGGAQTRNLRPQRQADPDRHRPQRDRQER